MRPLSCATLALVIFLGSWSSARADAITLHLTGTAFGAALDKTVDLASGRNQVSIPLGSVMSIHQLPPIGQPQPIDSAVYLHGTFLVDTGGSSSPKEADFSVFIPVQGSYLRYDETEDLSGTIRGTATATFRPGTDFSILPPWASNLTASVTGNIQDGYMNDLVATLNLSGSAPQQVPEPTTLGFFLLALTGLGLHRIRVRRLG